MHPEPEVCSMKILLKQVYGVHTTKIKSLEDEIEELKRNLLEATTKLKNYESECKRCIELEKAFNSCKAALLEQSKMFENLGQKFSTFNPTENKTTEYKQLKQVFQVEDVPTDEPNIHVAPVKKMDLSTNSKIHFLKNLMSLNIDENQESLELSVPLQRNMYQEYSTLNPDSMILVPNTMEFGCEEKDDQNKLSDKTKDCKTIGGNQVEVLEANLPDLSKNTENKERRKKRSSEDSDLNNDKLNKENEVKVSSGNKKIKSSIKDIDDNCALISKLAKIPTSPKNKNSKSGVDDFINNNSKKINTPALDVKICKLEEDDFVTDFKNFADKNSSTCATPKDDSFQVTVSPSLLPLKEKNTKGISHPPTMAEDINDFQITSSNKKANNDGGSWTSCDKRKLSRKSVNIGPIKSTSRFKMQLDSLPPNFKKPTYRQTKLSKSIFQAKSTTAVKQEPDVECIEVEEKFENFAKELATVSSDVPTISCSTKTVDFDATCIPDNFEYEIISSNSVGTTKTKTGKGKAFPNSIMIVKDDIDSFDSDSSSEMIELKPSASKHNKGKDILTDKPIDVGQLGNSFDRLPKKAEPDYKYKEDTVRKKSERKQLTAFDCKECEKYYSDLGLSDEEKKQRMQKCSRHRSKFAPPPTPEHFWELEFPDTQECKARGYLNETQKVKLKTHRKRPL